MSTKAAPWLNNSADFVAEIQGKSENIYIIIFEKDDKDYTTDLKAALDATSTDDLLKQYDIFQASFNNSFEIRIGQIDNIKQDILDKKEDVSKIVTQVQISRIELSEKQNEIKNEQEKLSQEIKKQMVEIAKLGRNTHDTINRGNTLIERVDKARLQAQALKIQAEKLMANSEDLLTKNQKTIDQQIKFVEASKNSIATAITGVKKKNDELTKEVRTNADKEFARNKEIISQFIEYQLLIQNGRGIFPDPNKAAELKILDKIAEILYPNIQDRNEFVNKLNKI
jgi:hypothetical protein